MGYKIVAVSPLNKPFPLLSFGLANVVSFDDAKKQIEKIMPPRREDGCSSDRPEALQERWAEGKIQPALEAHLARQKRRQVHFESACRLEGCDNPRRGKRSGAMQAAKSRRPGVHPLFCGAHMWLRRALTRFALNALHAKSANRVRLV